MSILNLASVSEVYKLTKPYTILDTLDIVDELIDELTLSSEHPNLFPSNLNVGDIVDAIFFKHIERITICIILLKDKSWYLASLKDNTLTLCESFDKVMFMDAYNDIYYNLTC